MSLSFSVSCEMPGAEVLTCHTWALVKGQKRFWRHCDWPNLQSQDTCC